ncbi:MAG TPA: hypothetical protein VFY12_14315 [Arenimonas sp.]|nr:hypothetical protein [Arenimonas sp.]
MKMFAPVVMALLLASCAASEPPGPDPAALAQAQDWLAQYEKLRAEKRFAEAEEVADRLLSRHAESDAAKVLAETLPSLREQAEQQREGYRLAGLWEYQTIDLDQGQQRTAAIYSYVDTDPEMDVQPVPDARLVLRRHPSWGRSAYLLLNQSRLQCGPPCRITLRFDSGEPQPWQGKPADSGQGPALFIVDEARFLEALRGAQRIRFELPKSGALVPAFEFEVGGFQPERLDP